MKRREGRALTPSALLVAAVQPGKRGRYPSRMTGLGGMRERPNRMVSKTIVAQVTLGSNPSPSAT